MRYILTSAAYRSNDILNHAEIVVWLMIRQLVFIKERNDIFMSNFRGGKVPSQESIDKADKIREEMVKEHLDIILKHRKGMSKNGALDEIVETLNYFITSINHGDMICSLIAEMNITPRTYTTDQVKDMLTNLKNYILTFKSVEESCLNCKHYDLDAEDEPCNHCRHAFDSELLSKFEEKESKDD